MQLKAKFLEKNYFFMGNSVERKPNSKFVYYQFANKQVMSHLSGLSTGTLKKYRLEGKLEKDIHWISVNSRVVRYNIILVLDWLQNHASDPQAHLRAVKNYLYILHSNQSKSKFNRF